ncbi:vacuolar protein sorting-associated protein 26C [Planococcus citri]|uniref:vacuolar protein sorting-associated protein 26C n=1 Tax=Planococcus citri TaxID=170843 RepID=UPI0031F8781B
MSVQVDIRLKRANKIYREGENVDGVIRVTSPTEFKHDGISLTMDGVVNMQLSPKNTGVFDAFYNSIKPVQLVYAVAEICPSKKMPTGTTEIPFEIPLIPRQHQNILETYHGVFINIQYNLKCELKRSFLSKDVIKNMEFIVENNKKDPGDVNFWKKVRQSAVKFNIVPENLRGFQDTSMPVPNFSITGTLHNTICDITKPFSGELCVKRSDVPIKSIELQLVRVETCGCAEGFARDATEVQNIQIADGDVARGLKIPIYMIFPRLFSCPTLLRPNFKIEFEVNLVIIFSEKHLVTENFPIVIFRP